MEWDLYGNRIFRNPDGTIMTGTVSPNGFEPFRKYYEEEKSPIKEELSIFDPDNVNSPSHYMVNVPATMIKTEAHEAPCSGIAKVECIDLIRSLGFMDSYCLASAFAYLFRCQSKGKTYEDISKAIKYLEWELEEMETCTDD